MKINAASGTLEKEVLTTGTKPVGVFMGCEYEDAALGLFHRNFWPASTVIKTGTNAWGYVVDDPDVLFELQANGLVAQASLGLNCNLVQTAGSTATGRSAVAAAIAGIANTATFPVRIVDFVRRPGSAVGDAFTDLIVRLNTHAQPRPHWRDLRGVELWLFLAPNSSRSCSRV